jgi:hypothetical protein
MSFGVFKTYKDGDCNDSPFIWIFENEEDAKIAVARLEELRLNGQKEQYWAYNEGWEFRAYWTYQEVEEPVTLDEFTDQVEKVLAYQERIKAEMKE